MSEPVNPTARDKARYRLASAVDGGDPNAVAMAVDDLIEAHLAEPHGDVHAPCAKLLAEEGRTKYLLGLEDGRKQQDSSPKRDQIHRLALSLCRVGQSCPWCVRIREQDGEVYGWSMARTGLHLKECPIASIALLSKPLDVEPSFVGGRVEPGPTTAGVDTRSAYPHGSACANGHDWHWQHEAPVHTRVWCRRCQRYPEHVADDLRRKLDEADADRLRWAMALREILGGRHDEDLPEVARRVMADLDFAQRSADAAVAARDRTGRAFAGLAANLHSLTKAQQDVVAEAPQPVAPHKPVGRP